MMTDMAREAVDPAAAALSRVRSTAATGSTRRRTRPSVQYSGPAADSRDPKRLGGVMDDWVSRNGYGDQLAVSGLLQRWNEVVGDYIADHVTVAEFQPGVGGGTVVLQADSERIALEMKYLKDRVLERFAEEVGPGLVARIDVLGPARPRTSGRLRVRTGRRSPRN